MQLGYRPGLAAGPLRGTMAPVGAARTGRRQAGAQRGRHRGSNHVKVTAAML